MKNQIVLVVGIVALLAGMSIGAGLLQVAPTANSIRVHDISGPLYTDDKQGGTLQLAFSPTASSDLTGISMWVRIRDPSWSPGYRDIRFQMRCPWVLGATKIIISAGETVPVYFGAPTTAWSPVTFIGANKNGDPNDPHNWDLDDDPDFIAGESCQLQVEARQKDGSLDLRVEYAVLHGTSSVMRIVWAEPVTTPTSTPGPTGTGGTASAPSVGAAGTEPISPEDARPADIGNLLLWAVVAILVLFGVAALFMAIWK